MMARTFESFAPGEFRSLRGQERGRQNSSAAVVVSLYPLQSLERDYPFSWKNQHFKALAVYLIIKLESRRLQLYSVTQKDFGRK